jgi:hypothetical protein
MTRNGIDISNYSSPFTQAQLDYVRDNLDWVCIGLQNAAKARAFRAQLEPLGKEIQYYVDIPGRDIAIAPVGSTVWIDIEAGCFQSRDDVLHEKQRLLEYGHMPVIYGNRYSIEPVFGQSTELSDLPLVHAEYPADGHVPDISEFHPYNGWTRPFIWQYSSGGVAGINADLCVSYEDPVGPAPEPQQPYVTYIKQGFSDGSEWFLEVKAPPGR